MAPIDGDINISTSISATLLATIAAFITLLVMSFVLMCIKLHHYGQKTRSQQQRRVYVGSRGRPSIQAEPSIYVSPANLPPPPKYEALAPPSYDEVMAVYPNYQGIQPQPIAYPLTHSVAQSSSQNTTEPSNDRIEEASASTVITVTADERRTSVTVATS